MTAPLRYTFGHHQKLHAREAFAAVFNHKLAKHAGPLRFHGRPNALPHARLGLSVSRRVGNAVTRNAIKRRLREAFRLEQHELPEGIDLVVVIKPHAPAELTDYRGWLTDAAKKIQLELDRRQRRAEKRQLSPTTKT